MHNFLISGPCKFAALSEEISFGGPKDFIKWFSKIFAISSDVSDFNATGKAKPLYMSIILRKDFEPFTPTSPLQTSICQACPGSKTTLGVPISVCPIVEDLNMLQSTQPLQNSVISLDIPPQTYLNCIKASSFLGPPCV